MEEISLMYCMLCNKTEDETELADIETNSLEYGEEIIEFGELFSDVLSLRLTNGSICGDCQGKLIKFYIFKCSVKSNLQHLESFQRKEILRNLDLYLEDFDDNQPLTVLRYYQCFTVVPESQRSLMDNFQSWQPRTQLERIKEDEIDSNSPAVDTFDVKVEDLIEDPPDMFEDEDFTEDFTEPEDDVNPKGYFKPTKEQRAWVNETVKSCYSVEVSEMGSIPMWTCCDCGKIYKSSQALRIHLLMKHVKQEILISEAKLEWIRKESRDQMALIETEDGRQMLEWNCGLCNFNCDSSKTFRIHLSQSHAESEKIEQSESIIKDWKCLKCDEVFVAENLLRQHFQKHTIVEDVKPQRKRKSKESEWTCKECWFQFTAQRTFEAHMRLHESLKCLSQFTDIFSCSDCKMFFRSEEDLSTHQKCGHILVHAEGIMLQKTILFKRLPIPLEAEKGGTSCGHCGRTVTGDINSRNHVLIQHISPLVCPKDDRKFSSMQAYVCHIQKVHADLFPESLACTHCKMTFVDIYSRLAHMKLCDAKQFTCDHCERRFSSKNQLNNHLKREMGLLSCKCSVCSKIFKAKDELAIHMRTHTKEKPFKCSICDKRYTTTSARASHMETHKDTVIECEVCLVKFVARRHYIVHYKRYHDEVYRQKKFQELTCRICQRQFLRKDRMREHMQKVHNKVE